MNEAEVEEITSSPVPEEEVQKTLDFPEAIKELTIGKRVQRLEWHDTEYGIVKDNILMIHRNEKDFQWIISMGDLLATDFVSF